MDSRELCKYEIALRIVEVREKKNDNVSWDFDDSFFVLWKHLMFTKSQLSFVYCGVKTNEQI